MIALAVAVGVLGVWGVLRYTLPHLRDRAEAQRQRQANCSHRWAHGEVPASGRWPAFPYRTCADCGKQEHLTHCPICHRLIDRDGRRVCEADGEA